MMVALSVIHPCYNTVCASVRKDLRLLQVYTHQCTKGVELAFCTCQLYNCISITFSFSRMFVNMMILVQLFSQIILQKSHKVFLLGAERGIEQTTLLDMLMWCSVLCNN